jgi:GDSL-like Lipase/Acylhydrolase family
MERRDFIRTSVYSGLACCCPWPDGEASGGASGYLKLVYRSPAAGFEFFSIDSLGKGQLGNNVVLPPGGDSASGGDLVPGWQLTQEARAFTLSAVGGSGQSQPFCFNISQHVNHATLLGRMKGDIGEVSLPAVIHFPDMGTLRVTCTVPDQVVWYETKRFIDQPYVRIFFPASRGIRYHFEVVAIHPVLTGMGDDPRYDGFRKNFISIFQLNPLLRTLANNSASDACAFTLYEYSEVALLTPPLVPGMGTEKGLTAMDLVRMTLDRYLAGQKGYGLLGYDYDKTWDIPESATSCNSLDSYPSLLIAACNYVGGTGDMAWFRSHERELRSWADKLLATDVDGDGLMEFCLSGNSGSWKGDKTMRPANWWDTIGFGHQDAYSNALAYRALVLLEKTYAQAGDAAHFREAALYFGGKARHLKEKYTATFYNAATGVLAGWKSADGQLHDYYFTFVNGMAICHGLVEPALAGSIMDKLLLKMKESGYNDFGLGLPGNLVPVRRADYTDLTLEVGGGKREDNADGFQIYENGGATACFAYYTIHALQLLGREKEADAILLPMLESLSAGDFQGRCANGRSKDWKTWKGECWGYEGFLADNYHFLLAVVRPLLLLLLLMVGYMGVSAQGDAGVDSQRVEIGPLSLVSYSVKIKAQTKDAGAYSFLRCYDSADRLLLEYKVPVSYTGKYEETGNYTETPPGTRYVMIGAAADGGGTASEGASGKLSVKDWKIEPNIGETGVRHAPLCDLRQYMKPFWASDTIYNETVLLYSSGRGAASGRLLYQPDRILSVRNYALDTVYRRGIDYSLRGKLLIRAAGSWMPFRADTSFDTKKDLAWFNLQSQWVVVSYTHHDKWIGPVPVYKGDRLPRLMDRLHSRRPVTIVAYGMSITRGMDVSGYDGVAPYMPPYMQLFAWGLQQRYPRTPIQLYNAGLPGSTVAWGAQYAEHYVSPLHPDLVVIDFGMNDFWRMPPAEFGDSVRTILRKVRSGDPAAEFLLLANLKFDPDYVLDSDKNKAFYTGNLAGYASELQKLEGDGIIMLDMTGISDAIYRRKKAKDCIVNPLHPNDYMARWYAQGMLQLLGR